MPLDIESSKSFPEELEKKISEANEFRQKLLDDLVSVNALFTVAVFVGLSFPARSQPPVEGRKECEPDPGLAKRLLMCEVLSFAFFLFSSMVAKTLKAQINLYTLNLHRSKNHKWARFMIVVTELMLIFSIFGTMLGCIFLTISMVYVVEIRLGSLSCKSEDIFIAVASLIVIVSLAIFIYFAFMVRAYRCLLVYVVDEFQFYSEEKSGAGE